MGWRNPVLVLALGVAVAGAATGFVYLRYRAAPAVMAQSAGPNAVWAAHRWVGEVQPAAAYDRLVGTLRDNRISDVFFHVGPLAADGTIDPVRYPNAGTLVAEIKRRLPGLRLQAWIGQREARGGGPLDLDDDAVRGRIVETARRFLDFGFDGIHYNFEPLFCLPARGNEKPHVENRVKLLERQWATPVPRVKDRTELNLFLRRCCEQDWERTIAGQSETIGQRFHQDQQNALPLPEYPFEAAVSEVRKVDKYQTVTWEKNY